MEEITMKEIRTIKMVEVTDIKFVADDGKEFVGENAERDCRNYERTRDKKRVEEEFKRVDMTALDMPFVEWFGDDKGFYKVQLTSRRDFVAMMDYINVVWDVWDNHIKEPTAYPYTMIFSYDCDVVTEYARDLKADLQKAIEQLG